MAIEVWPPETFRQVVEQQRIKNIQMKLKFGRKQKSDFFGLNSKKTYIRTNYFSIKTLIIGPLIQKRLTGPLASATFCPATWMCSAAASATCCLATCYPSSTGCSTTSSKIITKNNQKNCFFSNYE